MEDVLNPEWWAQKVDEFLEYSCEAEARGNRPAAELLLKKAMFFDAFLHGDVTTVKEYTTLPGWTDSEPMVN